MKDASGKEELEDQIKNALERLNPRQRRFALELADGKKSKEQAMLKAGYSQKSCRSNMGRLNANEGVRTAVDLIQQRYAIEHGESAAQHREHLRQLFMRAVDPESPDKDLRLGHQVRRTLMELDGFLGKENEYGDIVINLNTGVRREPITIDAEDT